MSYTPHSSLLAAWPFDFTQGHEPVEWQLVLATLQLGIAIIMEASITFLGLGIQPPNTAWGLIVADGRSYMDTAWWIPTFAGLCIMITVLGANLLGDWLRDKLDPRLRQL